MIYKLRSEIDKIENKYPEINFEYEIKRHGYVISIYNLNISESFKNNNISSTVLKNIESIAREYKVGLIKIRMDLINNNKEKTVTFLNQNDY